jgi:hypothetical protein
MAGERAALALHALHLEHAAMPLQGVLEVQSVEGKGCKACLTIASPNPEPPRSRERPASTR